MSTWGSAAVASPRQAPCTPRRRLAAALALDKQFYSRRITGSPLSGRTKRTVLYRAGKKIGDTYALVTVLMNNRDELEFSVHVPETCMEYRVSTSHDELASASRSKQVEVAQVLVNKLYWQKKGHLAFADVLRTERDQEEGKR